MIRKPETVAFWCGRLPHWEVEDGRYFVTIHLAGAIPASGQERILGMATELEKLPRSDHEQRLKTHRRIFAEMEAWLDRTPAVHSLENDDIARMVMESISFRQERNWRIYEYVIMPSHLHLFFELTRPGLKDALEQFKRWTGHEAAKLLNSKGEQFWQDEWFDHWSRSDDEDERIVQYIRKNPEKAGLVKDYRSWPYGSWSR